MRYLSDIITKIIEYVPDTIDDYTTFNICLKKLEYKVAYSAPEVIIERWRELCFLCYRYLDKYKGEDWEFLVRSTLNPDQAEKDKKEEAEQMSER